MAVDGQKDNADSYSDPGGNEGGAHWMQVDLGGLHHVEEVNLYRYWKDSRKYQDTVVLLSPDSSFDPTKTLVLWNGNRDENLKWPAQAEKMGRHIHCQRGAIKNMQRQPTERL